VGGNTLTSNQAGSNGVAVGYQSQYYANNTTTAWDNTNTSVGYRSLQGISAPASNTGLNNTAVGRQSMQITSSGSNNTASGSYSLVNNETGSDNTMAGYNSGIGNQSGNNNTAFGSLALYYNISGSNNTAIGYNAGPLLGFNALTNATAIGAGAKVSVSNALVLGNTSANVGIGLNNPTHKLQLSADDAVKPSTNTWTIISDARLKKIDGIYTKGLSEIMQLKPLLYHYKNTVDVQFSNEILQTQSVGFLAQDVQKIFPECVIEDRNGYLNMNIHAIIIAQVNAIREQQVMIEILKEENARLKARDALIQDDLVKIKAQLGL
jgi:trimeric autotransporter adhesin